MKRYIFAITTVILAVATVFAKDDFVTSLKNCSSYTDSGVVETEGMQAKSTKKILGWEGDRCVYKEKVNFAGMDVTTTCKFTKSQITELTSVMNAYSLVQKYSNESIDTSSLSAVQNNPVVKVWNKYMQDSSTCSMSGLDGLK
ncbi:hypothetical protein IKQ21_00940 [bacterium]|nr:hypothetical protein [bacterium]